MTTPFKLATVSIGGSPPYVAVVLGEQAFGLDLALERWGRAGAKRRQLRVSSMLDLLSDWEANFDVLQDFAEFVSREGLGSELWRGAIAPVSQLHFLAPMPHPGKMLYAAINYPRSGGRGGRGDLPTGARPYMFEKSSSAVVGPYDDVVKPAGYDNIDWEVELACVIGVRAKAITPERALDCVAGFPDRQRRDGP